MAGPSPVWIVQDKESCLFLTPKDGDVGYTPYLTEAGHFDSAAAAYETAADCCDTGFMVFPCFLSRPKF